MNQFEECLENCSRQKSVKSLLKHSRSVHRIPLTNEGSSFKQLICARKN